MKKLFILLLVFAFVNTGLVLPQQKIYKRSMTPKVNIKFKLQLKEISERIRIQKKPDRETLNKWKQLLTDLYSSKMPVDTDDLIKNVLQDSYLENKQYLTFFASKVKYFNKVKSEMRKYIKELRSTLCQVKLKPGTEKIMLKLKDFSPAVKFSGKFGKPAEFKKPAKLIRSKRLKFLPPRINYYQKDVIVTPEFLEDEIKKMEDKLKDIGNDAQLAGIDLQTWMKKQNQAIQTLANTTKVLREVASAVVRKLD